MTTASADVVVVGAGFTGLTVAREMSQRGHRVQVVDARDRIGGRTWTTERLGRRLDLGGSYVHWLQPHVWAEITRYGLAVGETMDPARALWAVGGKIVDGSPDDLMGMLDRGNLALLAESRRYFDRPYEPLRSTELAAIDDRSVSDVAQELGLGDEELSVLNTFWALNFSAPPQTGAFTQALRWCGVASGSWSLMFEACGTYKLRDGTSALAEAIAADSTAELRLDEPVRRIASDEGGVTTTTTRGELRSRYVVVTVPINVLGEIEFAPALSAAKTRVAREGQASQGMKAWVRLRGHLDPFLLMGEPDWPINLAATEYYVDDDTLLVAFGPRASALDANDVDAVTREVHRWRPELEVVDSAGHDWVADPYARETWGMLRPGQLTGGFADLREPEGRIHLAGSDLASGWAGFIDGAIESGMAISRVLDAKLSGESPSEAR